MNKQFEHSQDDLNPADNTVQTERGGLSAVEVLPAPHASEGLSASKLLIVDMDDLVLESMVAILGSWGYEVSTASSLEDLQSQLAGGAVWDMVISGYQLDGDATGLDVIEAVRKKFGKLIPGILISGDTDPAILKLANRAGHYLLHKPVKPAKLRALIQYWLEVEKSPSSLAAAVYQ